MPVYTKNSLLKRPVPFWFFANMLIIAVLTLILTYEYKYDMEVQFFYYCNIVIFLPMWGILAKRNQDYKDGCFNLQKAIE